MTEQEIIQGLECCAHIDGDWCRKCPYEKDFGPASMFVCTGKMANDALELIKKQQSIIDEYKKYDTFLAAHGMFATSNTDYSILDSLSEAELFEPMRHFRD